MTGTVQNAVVHHCRGQHPIAGGMSYLLTLYDDIHRWHVLLLYTVLATFILDN